MNWRALFRMPDNESAIDSALAELVPRRRLRKILQDTDPSFAVEAVAEHLDLNPEKLLDRVAKHLELPARKELVPISNLIVEQTTFSAEELRSWRVLPQPAETEAAYALVISDPSCVSVREFTDLGIEVFFSLGSLVERAWADYFAVNEADPLPLIWKEATPTTPEPLSDASPLAESEAPKFRESDVVPVLIELALECNSRGAKSVRLMNGSKCSYEFSTRGGIYAGKLHEDFVRSLGSFVEPASEKSFPSGSPELSTFLLKRERGNSLDLNRTETEYLLSWRATHEVEAPQVLLIDDDKRFIHLLSALLKSRSYSVVTCGSAKEALSSMLAGTLAPQMVICDIHMPQMDGGEFVAEIRNFGTRTPVLMLTSDDDVLLEAEMILLGANGYLQKREDPRVLLSWVENLLRRDTSSHR